MYLANEIDYALEKSRDKLLGANTYKSICYTLNRAFAKKDLKFRFETFDNFYKNDFSVSGLYDQHENTRYIIYNFSSNHDSLHLEDWKTFKFDTSQAIQHESIHQLQWQHRDPGEDSQKLEFRLMQTANDDEDPEYLADVDEIDAYAHDIAMEIKFYYPNRDPYEVFRNINRCRKLASFSYYKKTFRNCDWLDIRKRLLTKTFRWIKYV